MGSVPAAIEALPSGYHALFARAREVLEADDRVRAVWLAGSLARGTADAASDLDLIIAVADDHHEAFTATWRDWLSEITPTVLAEELPFAAGSFHSITPGFERFDVVVEVASATSTTFFPIREQVFDRDGLTAQLPGGEAPPGPSPDAVGGLIREYFRISAVETILVRDDWLLAREHLHLVHSLTYRLFVEANAPLPAMGVKQWSTKLTPAQRTALSSLPTDAADLEEFRGAQLATADVFLTNAEVLARRLQVEWPDELEAAAAQHLREQMGIDQPYPRGGSVRAV